MKTISATLAGAVSSALGSAVTSARRPSCGLSAAERWVVELADGRRVFVKAATDDATERWLRNETTVLDSVNASWAARIVARFELGNRPAIAIEDLSRLYWPADFGPGTVIWRPGDIERVLVALADVGSTAAPPGLPANELPPCWRKVLRDPDGFAAIGVATRAWMDRIAPAIVEVDESVDISGRGVVHGDVRSDNICIGDDRVVFVDWSNARRGDPHHDVAELLPFLHLEGSPPPWELEPDPDIIGFVARTSGHAALRTLNGDVPVQWLHVILRRILAIKLDWIAAALRLPRRDGPSWQQITAQV